MILIPNDVKHYMNAQWWLFTRFGIPLLAGTIIVLFVARVHRYLDDLEVNNDDDKHNGTTLRTLLFLFLFSLLPLNAQMVNRQITVDGAVWQNLNAAWNAALTSGVKNPVIWLGPGNYSVSSTLVEPSDGSCVSIVGVGDGSDAAGSSSATTITATAKLDTNFVSLLNADGTRVTSCRFSGFTLQLNKNAVHAFQLQSGVGVYIANVMLENSTGDMILLGSGNAAQAMKTTIRDVLISWDAAKFAPSERGKYGIAYTAGAVDSIADGIMCRNAMVACITSIGGNNRISNVHGFGYPYTCSQPPCNNRATSASDPSASYATDYVIENSGAFGHYSHIFVDSPAIAAFHLSNNATGLTIDESYQYWADQTSFFPVVLKIDASVTQPIIFSNYSCENPPAGTVSVDGYLPHGSPKPVAIGCPHFRIRRH